jgi:hypothetical protein
VGSITAGYPLGIYSRKFGAAVANPPARPESGYRSMVAPRKIHIIDIETGAVEETYETFLEGYEYEQFLNDIWWETDIETKEIVEEE